MPSRSRSRSRSQSRSPSRHHTKDLPHSASPISESDYFQKSDEFRIWLKDEKHKYFDELSGDKARSYFRKFVKAWNKGRLPKLLYAGISPSTVSAPSQTAYKWSFASKGSAADSKALREVREQVGAATYSASSKDQVFDEDDDDDRYGPGPASSSRHRGDSSSSRRAMGPTLPTPNDLILAREQASSSLLSSRQAKRKRETQETKERLEDTIGPREVGREGALEKKRARRENDREFRDARDAGGAGLDLDEKVTMGGGDGFQDAIAKRDAAKRRFEGKREEQAAAARERNQAARDKEKQTMDYLQQLAKQRFG